MIKLISFIDNLSSIDVICFCSLYVMIMLLFINICVNFKLSSFTTMLYSTIVLFCFLTLLFYCAIVEKPYTALFSNISFITLLFFYTIVMFVSFYNKKLKKNPISDISNNKANNNENSTINENKKYNKENIGIYNNYEYYYSKKDQYAEPYTNNFKKNEEIQENNVLNTNENKEKLETENDSLNNIIENKIEVNEIGDKVESQTEQIVKNNDDDIMNNEEIFEENNNLTVVNNNQQINIESVKQNILEQVQDMMNENNKNINTELNTIRNDIGNLRTGIQGMVDRMTQLFELLTITIQNATNKN